MVTLGALVVSTIVSYGLFFRCQKHNWTMETAKHTETTTVSPKAANVLESLADGSTTNSDGGGEEDASADGGVTRKKRRPTYQVRKDEKVALQEQILALQKALAGLETERRTEKVELYRAVADHRQLQSDVSVNHLTMAGAQSMMSSFAFSTWHSPLSSFIHLTTDPKQRKDFLASIYESKIDLTTKFILERSRFLDLRREHCHTESCELPNGDFVFTRFEVTPFGREFSAKRVYDEMLLFMSHQEISISETLGILTVVEGDDPATPTVRQNRLLSSFDDGLAIESNTALFTKFVPAGSESFGVGCVDYVDRDDLYPEDPMHRLTKDLSACGFVAACPPDVEGLPPIVTMTRWTSVRLRAPAFTLTKHQEIMARDSMRVWGDVMIKVMQERLGLR